MDYWDEDLEGNPYPFERHLSFFCCSGKLPLKFVLYLVGAFGFVKLMMSMISAGCGGTAFILCGAWMVLFVIFIFSYFFGILNNHGGFLQFMVIIFLANLVADLILQSQYLPEQPWTADKALDATMFCLFTIDEILNFILMVKISCCQTSC